MARKQLGPHRARTLVTLTDATNVAIDARLGDWFRLSTGSSRNILPPTGAVTGKEITIEIVNTGGGPITPTFPAGLASQALTALTTAAGVATGTTGTAHGLAVGDVVAIVGNSLISGSANPIQLYNGLWTVVTVPTATTFTFNIGTWGVDPNTATTLGTVQKTGYQLAQSAAIPTTSSMALDFVFDGGVWRQRLHAPTHKAGGGDPLGISDLVAPTANVPWNSRKITGLLDPTASQDAATKAYVDASAVGLSIKASCRLATNAALPANIYVNGAAGVGATLTGVAVGALTVDGVAVAVGDRILVKDEATGANNGIYTVTTVGTGAVVYVLTRATDFDQASELSEGAFTFIAEGATNQHEGWLMTTAGPYTMGTTALSFTQFSAAGEYVAGTGITITGTSIAHAASDTGQPDSHHVRAHDHSGAGEGQSLAPATTLALTGVIAPAQITADQNDYNPANLATSAVLRLSTDALRNITGLQGGSSGRVLIIHNVGSFNIVLKAESASSSAANRFSLVADELLLPNEVVVLIYDSTSSRWRDVGSGSAAKPDVQTFNSSSTGNATQTSGTWTKPTGNYTTVRIFAIGGGGGGASGASIAAATAAGGGAGGAGGGAGSLEAPIGQFLGTETVKIGDGGSGGNAVTGGVAGNAGRNAGASSITVNGVTALLGRPGSGGNAGSATGASVNGGAASGGMFSSGGGGNGSQGGAGGAGQNGSAAAGGGGGGGGGGITAATPGATSVGGAGGVGGNSNTGGSAGAAGTGTGGGAGGSGTDWGTSVPALGGGGGGGGSESAAGQNGGAGGAGTKWGGGGGGGGASRSAGNSGAGGNGAPGIVVVVTS